MIRPVTPATDRRTASWRTITGVIALYALVLHAVLGGLGPLPTAAMDHGVLCLGQVDAAPADAGAPDAGHHGRLPCCTVPAALVTCPPDGAAQVVAWPRRLTHAVAWRPQAQHPARALPGTIAHPRGPPVV